MNCKFGALVRKWHHNSDDSTDIIFRLILSVLYFSLLTSCVIHHLLYIYGTYFMLPSFKARWSVFTIKVWICWCTSVFFSKQLMELSPILSITVGQIEKTRFLVNLKYHKIIISFFILPPNTTVQWRISLWKKKKIHCPWKTNKEVAGTQVTSPANIFVW